MEKTSQSEIEYPKKISIIKTILCFVWIFVIMFFYVIINGTWVSLTIAYYLDVSKYITIIVSWIQPLFTAGYQK